MNKRTKHFLRFGLLAAWLGIVSAGMAGLLRYSAKPGTPARDPVAWPGEWELRPEPRGTTLVVALHPRCACSRATLGELEQLMTQNANGLRAYVLMIRPEGTPDGFERGALWDMAAAIPSVTVIADPAGRLSSRLGAETSGQTYAFNPQGKLLFAGGITPARGHMGDSAGAEALTAILLRETPRAARTEVFGCSLRGSEP
jgi:hypothetical protein